MRIIISFLLAVFIHAALFIIAGNFYKPAEVQFKPGDSAIEMTIVSSMERIAKKREEIQKEEMNRKNAEKTDTSPKTTEVKKKTKAEQEIKVERKLRLKSDEIETDGPKNEIIKKAVFREKEISTKSPKETGKSFTALNIEKERPVEPEIQTANQSPVKNENIENTRKKTNIQEKEVVRKIEHRETDKKLMHEKHGEKKTISSKEAFGDLREKGTKAAVVIGIEKPRYPKSCRKRGHEGVCILLAEINKKGRCTDVQVLQTAGCSQLDKSAIRVLKKATFIPAERYGMKTSGTKKISFKFKIEDEE